jgi:hypothetical protein
MKKAIMILIIAVSLFVGTVYAAEMKGRDFATMNECIVAMGLIHSKRTFVVVTNTPCNYSGYFKEGGHWGCNCDKSGVIKGWYYDVK